MVACDASASTVICGLWILFVDKPPIVRLAGEIGGRQENNNNGA
jgi:hypothetical protein